MPPWAGGVSRLKPLPHYGAGLSTSLIVPMRLRGNHQPWERVCPRMPDQSVARALASLCAMTAGAVGKCVPTRERGNDQVAPTSRCVFVAAVLRCKQLVELAREVV